MSSFSYTCTTYDAILDERGYRSKYCMSGAAQKTTAFRQRRAYRTGCLVDHSNPAWAARASCSVAPGLNYCTIPVYPINQYHQSVHLILASNTLTDLRPGRLAEVPRFFFF